MTRFLLYSHDTYGLGHFRRSCLIASGLVDADTDNEVLIVTGSPRAQAFRLPDRVDTVKLPTATKNQSGSYRPRKLGGSIEGLVGLRSDLICSATASYEPDVILVDHAPLGMGGELAATLDLAHRLTNRPRIMLGLRDIIDDHQSVEAAWERVGIWPALDLFDDILVYGDPRVTTTAMELGLEHRTHAKVTHTGYVAPTMPEGQTQEPFLLVTPGGGGDGQVLLRRFLDAVQQGATEGLRSLVVTGPLLSAGRRAEVMTRAESLPSVDVIEFSDRMRSFIASATGVISMAGYNTVVEELGAATPSLLVPRRWPRLEQHIRASRLAQVTNLEHCPLEDLSPQRIRDFADSCHQAADPSMAEPLNLSGVAAAVSTFHQLPNPGRTPTNA